MILGVSVRARVFGWAICRGLAGASSTTRSLARLAERVRLLLTLQQQPPQTAKAAEWSASLVSERTTHSQIDAYVGGDGGWASGEVDPDEDDYPSSGGSDGDDFGADDY